MKFKQYMTVWKIIIAIMIASCFTGYFVEPLRNILTIFMISIIILGTVFFLIFGKCPSCKKIIPFNRIFFINDCPFCSKNLYE